MNTTALTARRYVSVTPCKIVGGAVSLPETHLVVAGLYQDNSPALALVSADTGEPWVTVTFFDEARPKGKLLVKTWSENRDLIQHLQFLGLFEEGSEVVGGTPFVEYHAYTPSGELAALLKTEKY